MRKIILLFLFAVFMLTTDFSLAKDELSPAEIMEKYGNAVVLIATIKNNEEISQGSGFIVKDEGVIVTNYHVIEAAYPALIKLKSGDIYEDISVIDYNERKDIAVIKVKAFDLPTVVLGNSNNVKVGEKVVVIGNPHGFENTIADGLLSQIRDTKLGYRLHQISAPISPGSSGSPVFNSSGEVIGIATLSDIEGQNLNFSVPINYVRGMIDNPIKYSLEEFAGLEKDESILRDLKITETVDSKKFLKEINNAYITLVASFEFSMYGLYETGKPHKHTVNQSKFLISRDIYTANQMLKNAYKDLDRIRTSNKELKELKNKLLIALKEAHKGSDRIISALEEKIKDAYYGTLFAPAWGKASAALDEIQMAFRKLDRDFKITFVDKIKKDNPELENKLLPLVIEAYENRDKSDEEMLAENRKLGHIGVIFRLSTRRLIIIEIIKKSPAKRAGLKENDIILGVVDGPDFITQMDYREFQKTTKPGDKYKFRIERKGKVLKKTIKMN